MTTADPEAAGRPSSTLSREAFSFAVRASLFYAATAAIMGVFLPYMPVLLEARGLSHEAIGLVLAIPAFARMVASPVVAFAYDKASDTRRLIGALGLVALVGFVVLGASTSFALIILAVILHAVSVASMMPLSETIAMRGVSKHGLSYGRMRPWASVAFIVVSFATGQAVAGFGPEAVPVMLMLAAVAVLAVTAFLPDTRAETESAQSTGPAPLRLADAGQLFKSRRFLAFIGTVSLIQVGHAMLFAFATVHWHATGISASHISALWGVGIVAEIVLFIFAAWPLRLLGPGGLVVLGAVGSIIRWGCMALDPPLWALYVLQAMHGLSFGCTHLGTMFRLAEGVPRRLAGTAQGVFAAFNGGLMMGCMTLASGAIYAALGEFSYLVMAGLSVIALWPALVLTRQRGPMFPDSLPAPPAR